MDGYIAATEPGICRKFREACFGTGSTILRGQSEAESSLDFARSVASGLMSNPRRLECRFLYDSCGSALFERITQQPEYYLTRTETSILAANASRIREVAGPATLVELGSGNSAKTDHLLRAWLDRAPGVRYVPVDVSESALIGACGTIASHYPQARVIGVNSDYHDAFALLSQLSPALLLLLGSSIGNFAPPEMSRFLSTVAASLQDRDFFLLGLDLVKDPAQLEAAYNDAAGVTASFTRNLFARMNRELGCDIDVDAIEHVARYDQAKEQIEIFARFTKEQTFFLAPLDRYFTVAQGEMVQTEISRKFRVERFVPYLEEFGFAAEKVFRDERDWFALILMRRRPKNLGPARGGRHD